MADQKLSALGALTGANLASGDEFLVLDVSDTTMSADGTDKAITATELSTGLAALAGGHVLISEQILGSSAATVTFSSIPSTYSDLLLKVVARGTDAGAAVGVNMQFNGDTGSNYDRETASAAGTTITMAESLGITSIPIAAIAAGGAPANVANAFTIEVPGYKGTTFQKSAMAMVARKQGTSTGTIYVETRSGFWRSTSAITSIVLSLSAGSFATGSEFRLYGLR